MAKDRLQRDVIIIGAGFAGLTAALYASRMNLSVLVLESEIVGGQIVNAHGIENYPGIPEVAGRDLIAAVQGQAEKFGAVIDEFDLIEKVDLKAVPKIVETGDHIYEAGAVIIASGMARRKMPLPEASRYDGRGIHYCELCDGHMYGGKDIAVMGGGNAALDAASFLTKYARNLYIIHRSEFRADEVTVAKIKSNPKVKIFLETEIRNLQGEGRLESLHLYDKKEAKEWDLPVSALFVNIGVVPNTSLFAGQVAIN